MIVYLKGGVRVCVGGGALGMCMCGGRGWEEGVSVCVCLGRGGGDDRC